MPLHQEPGQDSVPVQIRFDHKPLSPSKPQFTEYYNILEFKTNNLVSPALFSVMKTNQFNSLLFPARRIFARPFILN